MKSGKTISRWVECDGCDNGELTRQTMLPDMWIITLNTGATLCTDCQYSLQSKYQEFIEYIYKEGEGDILQAV